MRSAAFTNPSNGCTSNGSHLSESISGARFLTLKFDNLGVLLQYIIGIFKA